MTAKILEYRCCGKCGYDVYIVIVVIRANNVKLRKKERK
jgi:hypothetical protein